MPCVSVLTPARDRARSAARKRSQDIGWDDSDDEEDGEPMGMSPPKTIQFHVPQGRLMRTPGMFDLEVLICNIVWRMCRS